MTSTTSDSSDSKSLIIKTDVLGRMLTPRHRREQLLDEFERSGLSGGKFAALSGLKYQTFANWVQQRRKLQRQSAASAATQAESSPARTVQWLEAVVGEAQSVEPAKALTLQLPGGVRVELSATEQVSLAAALVRALQ